MLATLEAAKQTVGIFIVDNFIELLLEDHERGICKKYTTLLSLVLGEQNVGRILF